MPVVIGEVEVQERPAPVRRGEASAGEAAAGPDKKEEPVRVLRREAARRARVRAT